MPLPPRLPRQATDVVGVVVVAGGVAVGVGTGGRRRTKLFLAGRSKDRPVFLSKAKREGPHSGPSGKINGMERGIIGHRVNFFKEGSDVASSPKKTFKSLGCAVET